MDVRGDQRELLTVTCRGGEWQGLSQEECVVQPRQRGQHRPDPERDLDVCGEHHILPYGLYSTSECAVSLRIKDVIMLVIH